MCTMLLITAVDPARMEQLNDTLPLQSLYNKAFLKQAVETNGQYQSQLWERQLKESKQLRGY